MKKLTKMLAAFALLVGVFGVAASQKETVVAEAAATETKRVWMKNSITATWDKDGAGTAIHYWGGAAGTTFPGVRTNWDSANELVYFDLPSYVTHYMFVRVSGFDEKNPTTISDWGAKTADLDYTASVGNYFDLSGPIGWDGATTPGSFKLFGEEGNRPLLTTTTIVSDLVAAIGDDKNLCDSISAGSVITLYNSLSTFELNQFSGFVFEGGFTGLQRLVYLSSYYDISLTPSSVRNVVSESKHQNISALVSIGVISLTSIAGYYFLKTKKFI